MVKQYRYVLSKLKDFTGSISLDIPDEDTFDNLFTSNYKKNLDSAVLDRIKFHGSNAKSFTARLKQENSLENNPSFSTKNIISHLKNNANQQVNKASNDIDGYMYVDEDYLKDLENKEKSNARLISEQTTQIQELQNQLKSFYEFINRQQDIINEQKTEIGRLNNFLDQEDTFNKPTKKRSRRPNP